MDERSILVDQIEALRQELVWTESTFNKAEMETGFHERLIYRFDKLINRQNKSLDTLLKEVKGNNLPLTLAWDAFGGIRQDCLPLFRECLAFLEGALVRSAEVDDGLCQIADALLDDLSRRTDVFWGRFTILAEGEAFGEMAEIIRLRFPEVSIWNLPLAAHQFGQFVGRRLEVRRSDGWPDNPFQKLVERERLKQQEFWSYLYDHFADLFATYVLGPAYACTCILMRFNPRIAYSKSVAGPNDSERAHVILSGLEKLDPSQSSGKGQYSDIIKCLRDLWVKSLNDVGQPVDLEQATRDRLNSWLEELSSLLEMHLPRQAQYPHRGEDGWLVAQKWAAHWQSELDLQTLSIPGSLSPAAKLRDALNAAWLCRINNPSKSKEIEKAAYQLCWAILEEQRKPLAQPAARSDRK